jgi:hypothetical protein
VPRIERGSKGPTASKKKEKKNNNKGRGKHVKNTLEEHEPLPAWGKTYVTTLPTYRPWWNRRRAISSQNDHVVGAGSVSVSVPEFASSATAALVLVQKGETEKAAGTCPDLSC